MDELANTPKLELVGDWSSARILIRLLQVISSPWALSRAGLTHKDTGETCILEMRGRDPALMRRFETGECPVRPSLDPSTREAIANHRAVLTVRAIDSLTGLDAARAVLRCGAGMVDGGGVAVRCLNSGLAHSADRWQTLDRMATGAEDDGDARLLRETLYLAFVMPLKRMTTGFRTLGMAMLEAPDVVTLGQVSETRALDAMELLCLRTLGGESPVPGESFAVRRSGPRFQCERGPDPSLPTHREHNPYGLWRISPSES